LSCSRNEPDCPDDWLEEVEKMATQFCQKCQQAHPGRICDYDEKGECAETVGLNEVVEGSHQAPKERKVTPENDENPRKETR
jgi:hypothetical protein